MRGRVGGVAGRGLLDGDEQTSSKKNQLAGADQDQGRAAAAGPVLGAVSQ